MPKRAKRLSPDARRRHGVDLTAVRRVRTLCPRHPTAPHASGRPPMCVDHDSRPPITPISGGSAGTLDLKLASADGTRVMAHVARAKTPSGAGMIVIPDVRGLHAYYKELADRFAEVGVDAVAIDFFARTAPSDDRGESFDFMSHVPQTKPDLLQADIAAAAAYLRGKDGGEVRSLFSVGFCFGGALSYLQAASGL